MGNDIYDILTAIRSRNYGSAAVPATGATTFIRGHSKLEIANPTAADMFCEIIEFCFNETGAADATSVTNSFAGAWAYSYASRASGFEDFPTTSLKQNWAFWLPKWYGVIVKRTRNIRVKPSAVRRIIFPHSTTFSFFDTARVQASSGFRYGQVTAHKSTFYAVRVRFATGIVSGSTDYSGEDPPPPSGGVLPLIAPVGGDVAFKVTNYYSFRVLPGQDAVSQSGTWLAELGDTFYPGDESISPLTSGWAPDPHMRRVVLTGANAADSAAHDFTGWGPFYHGPTGSQYEYSPNQTIAVGLNGNVVKDVSGDSWPTYVSVTP